MKIFAHQCTRFAPLFQVPALQMHTGWICLYLFNQMIWRHLKEAHQHKAAKQKPKKEKKNKWKKDKAATNSTCLKGQIGRCDEFIRTESFSVLFFSSSQTHKLQSPNVKHLLVHQPGRGKSGHVTTVLMFQWFNHVIGIEMSVLV